MRETSIWRRYRLMARQIAAVGSILVRFQMTPLLFFAIEISFISISINSCSFESSFQYSLSYSCSDQTMQYFHVSFLKSLLSFPFLRRWADGKERNGTERNVNANAIAQSNTRNRESQDCAPTLILAHFQLLRRGGCAFDNIHNVGPFLSWNNNSFPDIKLSNSPPSPFSWRWDSPLIDSLNQ
jgi:hypothetical protein